MAFGTGTPTSKVVPNCAAGIDSFQRSVATLLAAADTWQRMFVASGYRNDQLTAFSFAIAETETSDWPPRESLSGGGTGKCASTMQMFRVPGKAVKQARLRLCVVLPLQIDACMPK